MADSDKAYVNARSIIANAIVCQLMPGVVVKGGNSLKIRFGDAATRFTTDLDTAHRAQRAVIAARKTQGERNTVSPSFSMYCQKNLLKNARNIANQTRTLARVLNF